MMNDRDKVLAKSLEHSISIKEQEIRILKAEVERLIMKE